MWIKIIIMLHLRLPLGKVIARYLHGAFLSVSNDVHEKLKYSFVGLGA